MSQDRTAMLAKTPAEALQSKMSAIAFARLCMAQHQYGGAMTRGNARDIASILPRMETYLWADKTAQVVLAASESYPIEPRLYVPKLTHAFCAFQSPALWVDIGDEVADLGDGPVTIPGGRAYLSCLAWTTTHFVNGDTDGIMFYGFFWRGAYAVPIVVGAWPIIENDKQLGQDAASDIERFARFVLTASAFVEQRIAIPSGALQVQRQSVKQAERAGVIPTVKTIILRASERTGIQMPSEGESSRDYSCRWIVRGHWRNQYYARAGRHVPIWIDSHIKGPEDKPLRAPVPEVFAVTR